VKLQYAGFTGELPRLHPRLLPENAATAAYDTRLENGALVPLNGTQPVFVMPVVANTIYRRPSGEWLYWVGQINAVDGPVAADRTYLTGNGAPQVLGARELGQEYSLALPAPTAPLVITPVGVNDSSLAEAVYYTYTLVTILNEESQPAPLSNQITITPNVDVSIVGWNVNTADRGIDRMRIYRSQTDEVGTTDLYLVAELLVDQASPWVHSLTALPLQENIPSAYYDPPPDSLNGITACPNGILAAFSGKDLYFSEPYRPHAWPQKYSLTVDFDIVGLAAIGTAIVVMTKGTPYVAQGSHPETMVLQRIEQNLPCVSARGIVDMGFTVAYPSTEGLVTVGEGGAQLITRSLFTRKQWAALNASTFAAGQHIGRYIAAHQNEDGETQVIILDLTGEQPFVIRTKDKPTAMFFEIGSGTLYLALTDAIIYEWDVLTQPARAQRWVSRPTIYNEAINFGAILIDTDPQEDERSGVVNVFADGQKVATVTNFDAIERLPSGFKARTWHIEVEGSFVVSAIQLATTPSEIVKT
jgi:hypothetical protein